MLFLFMSKPDFGCNPYALWKYIVENTEHQTAWLVKSPTNCEMLRERGIRCDRYNTREGNALVTQADYVIGNVYAFPAVPKREGQIFVNLWHGSGVKAHDYYDPQLAPQQVAHLQKFCEETDLMCVHSLDDRFRLSAMLHYDMRRSVVTGQPRLDCVKSSQGKEKLRRIFGEELKGFEKLIFFTPSFRANASAHAGKFYANNVLRLDDYDDAALESFLREHNAALIYKRHPVEETTLQGVEFEMNPRCFQLTERMLFDADVRYDEILNAFDVMISDYSSIAFDFLLLDRPLVYLVPDYNEYKAGKGFVFHNIDYYMPGAKAFNFPGLLVALEEAFACPENYRQARKNVLDQRFDWIDDQSAARCYQAIMSYAPPVEPVSPVETKRLLPSNADLLSRYLPEEITPLDAALLHGKDFIAGLESDKQYLYISSEAPPEETRNIVGRVSTDIQDLELYERLRGVPNVSMAFISGGVDYEQFARKRNVPKPEKTTIGFAGTIDGRIYFAMVQYLCEAFPDCDIVFAGDVFGNRPAWLSSYPNLKYIGPIEYERLPDVIQSFHVALLPFFGKHKKQIPTELFQYLACGKPVVTSNMPNLPKCRAIYQSDSVAHAVEQTKRALAHREDADVIVAARETAREFDWSKIAAMTRKNLD